MKKWRLVALIAVAAFCLAGVGVWAAGNYGTESDPLVAMSYLEDELAPALREEFNEALEEAVEGLGEAPGEFVSVTLDGGGVSLGVGAEVVCLEPGAAATGTLVDLTSGGVANPGDVLSANHLYVVADNNTVLSGEGEALIRGGYVQ